MKDEAVIDSAYNRGHQLEPTEDFDYDAVDAALGWKEPGAQEVKTVDDLALDKATVGFVKFLLWVWLTPKGHYRSFESSTMRLLAATATVRPDILEGRSLSRIAAKLGVTRAALSKISVEFSDKFGVHFRCQKRAGARVKYAAAARAKKGS
jgi:hypothetical protein